MKYKFERFKLCAILAVTILGVSTTLVADDPDDKLPTAEIVIKKFVEAQGGADKIKAVKSMKRSGKFVANGIEGKLEETTIAPNLVFQQLDIGSLGTQTVISNGVIAWENSTTLGPRILTGKEKSRAMEQANTERLYSPTSFYKSIKLVGVKEMFGQKTYQIKTETKDGFQSTDYFSIDTGLPVCSEFKSPSPLGETPMKTRNVEYKDFGGVKFPAKIEIESNGIVATITYEKIELNPKVDKTIFAVPAEIQNMIDNTDN